MKETKNVVKYTESLENYLMYLTEDELMEFFEKNTLLEEKSLLELILEEKENEHKTV